MGGTVNRFLGADPIDVPFGPLEPEEEQYLESLASSAESKERALCLDYLDACLSAPESFEFNLRLLDKLASDEDRDIQSMAIYMIGLCVNDCPAQVWPLILKHGSVQDEETRAVVAACLLEHLLERHFKEYFPKVEYEIRGGNQAFVSTLSGCIRLGQSDAQWERLTSLVKEFS
jgi:hypothetical protein